jgi:hypothetical protein
MDKKELTVEDIKLVLRGKENFPLIYVSGYDDKDYTFMRKLATDIYKDTPDSMYDTSMALKKIFTTIRYMESYDYEKLVEKIRSYC